MKCVFQCPHGRKKSKINLWTSFDLIMIKTDVRNGPFRWYRQAYLTLFWKFWSPVKATKSNLFVFSGHLDIEQPFPVKKSEIWQKMRQWRGGSIFKVSQKRIMDNWQCSNKEPPSPWLKLCQISNFLTQMASLLSEWPEKVKKSSIEHYLASEPSKPFSEKPLFSDIIQHIWLCFDESEAL